MSDTLPRVRSDETPTKAEAPDTEAPEIVQGAPGVLELNEADTDNASAERQRSRAILKDSLAEEVPDLASHLVWDDPHDAARAIEIMQAAANDTRLAFAEGVKKGKAEGQAEAAMNAEKSAALLRRMAAETKDSASV